MKATRALRYDSSYENSHKFWTIELNGPEHHLRWGRIGSAGQAKTKRFASDDAAHNAYYKIVQEKLAKGYVDDPAYSGVQDSALKPVTEKEFAAAAAGLQALYHSLSEEPV